MISLVKKLKRMRVILEPMECAVYHYWRPNIKDKKYIIWAEDSEDNSYFADNHDVEQGIHGTVDLYTHEEYDQLIDDIQDALDNDQHVRFRLNSVQYEDETNLIHYEWEFTIYG